MKYTVLIPFLLSSTLFAQNKTLESNIPKQKSEDSIFSKIDINKDEKVSFKEIHDYKVKIDIERMKVQVEETFKRCDKNKDGKISKEETSSKSADKENLKCRLPAIVLDTMDQNQDGFLDKKEAMDNIRPSISQRSKIAKQMRQKLKEREDKIRAKYIVKRFEICDKDKDELLTLREATSRVCGYNSDTFDELDKNLDELLSFEEMSTKIDQNKALQKELKSKTFQEASPLKKFSMAIYLCDSDNDGLLSQDEAYYADCGIQSVIFKKYDFNKDGYIDRDENAMVHESKNFEKYDKDKDGFLDKDEFLNSRYAKIY